ncbi:MAG TPA: DUF2934 domain-containing protein [Verrucomicrobiae bacterium]
MAQPQKGNNKSRQRSGNQPGREQTTGAEQTRANRLGNGTSGNSGNGDDSVGNGASIFSSEEIAARAYQIFEREGRTDGRDMDHWLQAEQELRREREKRGGPNANAMNAENSPRSARQHQQQS